MEGVYPLLLALASIWSLSARFSRKQVDKDALCGIPPFGYSGWHIKLEYRSHHLQVSLRTDIPNNECRSETQRLYEV